VHCQQAEIFEIISRWRENRVPLQCHYVRQVDSIHISRGFVTALSPDRFEFTPMCVDIAGDPPLIFDYTDARGEYGQRARETWTRTKGGSIPGQCGLLSLHAADGTLIFIEMDD
jgi:hypothetical protein